MTKFDIATFDFSKLTMPLNRIKDKDGCVSSSHMHHFIFEEVGAVTPDEYETILEVLEGLGIRTFNRHISELIDLLSKPSP